jgi:acetylornithine deacetylase
MNTIEWLTKLIQFNTVSSGSNLELIHFIDDWLRKEKIETRLTYNPARSKANLFAMLPASQAAGGIMFSGHTDVVPVEGQQWNTDPFQTILTDNKIYGRGACDMKGFLAVLLALVPELKKIKLDQPVYFAFSHDEEVGCIGAPLLIADLQAAGIQPKACVVGEPTSMCPVIAHKGLQIFRCKLHGKSAHSSLTPQGCNAIEYAAKLICYIREMANEFKQQGPFDACFDVPFTTMSNNILHSGTAANIIPAECELIFEFRHLPKVSAQTIISKIERYAEEELLPAMKREYSEASITFENLAAAPAFETTEENSIYKMACDITGEKNIHKVAYATEAGLFQLANIPTIICGPGSIEQAHKENEFVTLEQLKKCEEFVINMVKKF